MIVAPIAIGLWAVAIAWPSESHGHTIIDQIRFRSEDACIQAMPRYEAIARDRFGGRGSPICVRDERP